jgi:MoaA/NifB/PqqE/SkfB family radical SAM enzyme
MFLKINKLSRMARRTTGLKLLNLVILYFQKYIQKGDYSFGKPMSLLFDPSSICNLHCPLCPTGQGRTERTKTITRLSDYKKVIDDLKKYLFFVHITNWGEPLVNPELVKMIAYANKNNIDTVLYTNLTLLKTRAAAALVRSGLNEIIVSIDGATERTYAKYRIGGNFNQVLSNLKLLVAIKKKYSSRIIIKWQFLVSSQNEQEL